MTREYALKVNKALESIDFFEIFIDRIEQVLAEEGADVPDMISVEDEIRQILAKDLERRKQILENL